MHDENGFRAAIWLTTFPQRGDLVRHTVTTP